MKQETIPESKPLVIIAGPTAVGKTQLSLMLAEVLGGEIISADSMQVYRGMDIGTAKIKTEEMRGIRHYLIDELEPDEEFHVVRFQHLAKKYCEQIYNNGKIPILTGGTGFYIQALLYDIDFTENEMDTEYRASLTKLSEINGPVYLHTMLKEQDPLSAELIHPNNIKRVIRALEFYKMTGKRISEHNEIQHQNASPFEYYFFVLTNKRELLYQNIDKRVDNMLAEGLLGEVKALQKKGYSRDLVSMQGLGYKELFAYLEGECTLEDAVLQIKRGSRHFAKRQLTWFKREKEVIWLDKGCYQSEEAVLQAMLKQMELKGRNFNE